MIITIPFLKNSPFAKCRKVLPKYRITKNLLLLAFLTIVSISIVQAQYKTITAGSYTSSSTWLGGVVPPANSDIVISHAVFIKSASVSTKKLTLANGGNLTVDTTGGLMASEALTISGGTLTNNGGTINVGTSGGGNKVLGLSSGTLNLQRGITNVNGNIILRAGNFKMSGGNLTIDPNSGVSATSVSSSTIIFNISSSVVTNVTAGTITFVDPPFAGTGKSLAYSGSTANANWGGSTIVFGGQVGTNTNAGALTGFNIDTRASASAYLVLGNVVANGGAGTNRFITGATSVNNGFDIGGNLVINAGCEVKTFATGAMLRIKGNLINNGILTDLSGISFSQRSGPNTVAQTVSGSGKFLNAINTGSINAPYFTNLEFNNTATPIAVKFAISNSNPGIYITGKVAFTNGVISFPEVSTMYFTEKAIATRLNGFMLTHKGQPGQMAKRFAVGASKFTFHIGDNDGRFDYTPATLEYTSNNTVRWMGVRVDDGGHPNLNTGGTAAHYLTRYFDVKGEVTGTWNAKFSFNYLNEDIVGSPTGLKYSRWNGNAWEQYNGTVAGNVITVPFTNTTFVNPAKGDYTARLVSASQDSTIVNSGNYSLSATKSEPAASSFTYPDAAINVHAYSGAYANGTGDIIIENKKINVSTGNNVSLYLPKSFNRKVIIRNCVFANSGNGDAIHITNDTQVEIINCRFYSTSAAAVAKARAVYAYKPYNLSVQNCYFEQTTTGVHVDHWSDTKGGTLTVKYNKVKNIDGRGAAGYVQFVSIQQAYELPNAIVEWNQVINEPNKSRVEDNINIGHSSGTQASPLTIRNNYIQGAYPYPANGNSFSGTGMTTDAADVNAAPYTLPHYILAEKNTIVSVGNAAMNIAAGWNVVYRDNDIVNSRILSDGTTLNSSWAAVAIFKGLPYSSTQFHDNSIAGNRINFKPNAFNVNEFMPAGNTFNSYSTTATYQDELNAYQNYLNKLNNNKVTIGVK